MSESESKDQPSAPDTARTSAPNLSRVQVYLYAVLALFVGVLLAGRLRDATGQLARDRARLFFVAVGVVVGLGLAIAVVVAVVRGMRDLPPDRRYRLSRLHTVALTGVLCCFLLIATVRPVLIAPARSPSGIATPTNAFAWLPVAAAATTLLALGIAYRRLNRRV